MFPTVQKPGSRDGIHNTKSAQWVGSLSFRGDGGGRSSREGCSLCKDPEVSGEVGHTAEQSRAESLSLDDTCYEGRRPFSLKLWSAYFIFFGPSCRKLPREVKMGPKNE